MSKREMLSLMIKLVGVYCLIQLVPGVLQAFGVAASSLSSLQAEPTGITIVLSMLMMAFTLLWIALYIWVIRNSDNFATRLYPVDAPVGQMTSLGVKDIQKLGYHFIGLTLIVKTLPTVVMAVYRILAEQGNSTQMFYHHSQLISPVMQLAIGLFLFLSPRSIANLWAKICGRDFSSAQ